MKDIVLVLVAAISAAAVVVTAIVAYWQYRGRRPPKRKNPRLFLSTQMSGLTDEEYREVRQEVLSVVYYLRGLDHFESVYYFNEDIPNQEDFDESTFDVDKYLDELRNADYVVGVIDRKIISSLYFEVGYAIGRDQQVIYFVRDRDMMPIVMRNHADVGNTVKVIYYKSLSEVGRKIQQMKNNL